MKRKRTDAKIRLMQMVAIREDGCWEWTGHLNAQGYGDFRPGGRENMRKAHRVAYELHVGPIPDGAVLDHLCRNRRCVNPDHLEPVTHQENVARGLKAQQAVCRNGHDMTPENTGNRRDGKRACMTCHREQNRLRRARARDAA